MPIRVSYFRSVLAAAIVFASHSTVVAQTVSADEAYKIAKDAYIVITSFFGD